MDRKDIDKILKCEDKAVVWIINIYFIWFYRWMVYVFMQTVWKSVTLEKVYA